MTPFSLSPPLTVLVSPSPLPLTVQTEFCLKLQVRAPGESESRLSDSACFNNFTNLIHTTRRQCSCVVHGAIFVYVIVWVPGALLSEAIPSKLHYGLRCTVKYSWSRHTSRQQRHSIPDSARPLYFAFFPFPFPAAAPAAAAPSTSVAFRFPPAAAFSDPADGEMGAGFACTMQGKTFPLARAARAASAAGQRERKAAYL